MFEHVTNTARTWLQHWLLPDIALTQSSPSSSPRLPIQMAPAQVHSQIASYLSNIPVPDRQGVMLYLYDGNMYVEELTNRVVRSVLGKSGFVPTCETAGTVTEDVIQDFWELNDLDQLETQERLIRDYLIIGEVCELVGACGESFLLAPLLPQTIAQTVLDPKNYHKVIGVRQQTGILDTTCHKVITQERALTREALQKRRAWHYSCFLWQNIKKTAPIPAAGFSEDERLQKRGEPFLFSSSDLFQHLVNYLWTSIDRAQALNTFNWGFKISGEGTSAKKRERAKYWKTEIGTPSPNSAFFYTDEIEPHPFAFPAGVASAVEGLFKLMRDTAGWAASARNEDMGDNDAKYASMKQPGMTNPSVDTLVNIQIKCAQYHTKRLNYILTQKWEQGKIPKGEVDMVRGRPRFRFRLLSPEISKQDMGQATAALKTFEDAWEPLHARKLFTVDSLAAAEQKMVKELLDVELEIVPEDELDALKLQPQALPEPPENTDEPQEGSDESEEDAENMKKVVDKRKISQ